MTKDVRPLWPRRSPVAAMAGLVLGLCCTMMFVALRVRFANDAQRFWAKQYMAPLGPSWMSSKPKPIAVLLCGSAPAIADCPASVQSTVTEEIIPAKIDGWLKQHVYGEETVWRWLEIPFWLGGLATLGFMIVGGVNDRKHNRIARNGRRLRGPELVEPDAFNRKIKGDGFRIFLERNRNLADKATRRTRRTSIRILKRHENNNICAMADPGGGKTLLCFQVLDQVQERGEAAFVYDPHMQFTPRYYNEDRGDCIINPLDDRCPSWSPSDEIDTSDRAMAEANALAQAASLFPGKPTDRNWFFTYCCRLIWAYLIVEHQPDAHEMAHLLQHADPLIDIIVQETELKTMMAENAAQQRAGVLGHLTQIAYSLRQIPRRSEGRPHLILRDWAKTRDGWLYFTNTQDTRDGLRPIQSLMLDWLIMCILSQGERKDLPATMAMFDELQTLQRLEQLVALLTEGRKSLRVMYCIQGRSQIKDLYGELAEVLLSAPYSKFFMRTTEPEATEWLSKTVGDVEIERVHESRPVNAVGAGVNRTYTTERRIERLLLPSEFSGLDDLHGYLKYGNLICRLKMPIMPKIQKEPAFVPRAGEAVIQKPLPTMEMVKQLQAERNAEKAKKAMEAAAAKEEERKAEQEKMLATIRELMTATVALAANPPKPVRAPRKKTVMDSATGDLWQREVSGVTE